jgi:hypothetical protein
MLLNIISANYLENYKLRLCFNNGLEKTVDLEQTIFNDHRAIFYPLQNKDYFKNFSIKFNTISWDNEADFAPEYLLEIGT